MFDTYYRSLTPEQKRDFCDRCGLQYHTIRNAYLPKDPLKRRIPRPETMLEMIKASDGQLTLLGLIDYFTISAVMELKELDGYQQGKQEVRRQRNISLIDPE